MADNNMFILAGLGMAALWFMNRGGSDEDQVDQLAGAAMMASGEGTAPNAPFQTYSAPGNPSFFFNQGGQMTKVPGTNVPARAASDEDIGRHISGTKPGELEFTVQKSEPAAGTSDQSPINPLFASAPQGAVVASTVWDQQSLIAGANFMPLLAIGDPQGTGLSILGSNVDISNLSSKEQFRATDLTSGAVSGGFTTTAQVLGEYVRGFTGDYNPQTNKFDPLAAARAYPQATNEVIVSATASNLPWLGRMGEREDVDVGLGW